MFELSALAFKHFKGTVLKGNKAAHVKQLEDLMCAQPEVVEVAAKSAVTAPALTAPAPAAAVPIVRTDNTFFYVSCVNVLNM